MRGFAIFCFGLFISMGVSRMCVGQTLVQDKSRWPNWPSGNKILVVTTAQPAVKHGCRIKLQNDEVLTCSRRFGRADVTYRRQDVLALISPAVHERVYPFVLGFEAAAGAILYGGVVLAAVNPAAGIVVEVLGGLVAYVGVMGAAFSGNNNRGEEVLYLQAGKTLTVKLAY